MKSVHEVDGTTHFVPVQILSTYNNGCHIQINTTSGPRDLLVDKVYSFPKTPKAVVPQFVAEQEKLYTVEIPNPNSTLNEFQVLALAKNGHGKIQITQLLPGYDWKNDGRCHLTEAEIRKDFEWAWQFAKEV